MVQVPGAGRASSAKRHEPSPSAEGGAVGAFAADRETAESALDERHVAVLALLTGESCGLTIRQMQARLSWPAGEMASVLEELLRVGLVTRLNTIVPSYARRVQAVQEGRQE